MRIIILTGGNAIILTTGRLCGFCLNSRLRSEVTQVELRVCGRWIPGLKYPLSSEELAFPAERGDVPGCCGRSCEFSEMD